jgi:hypothetical protein
MLHCAALPAAQELAPPASIVYMNVVCKSLRSMQAQHTQGEFDLTCGGVGEGSSCATSSNPEVKAREDQHHTEDSLLLQGNGYHKGKGLAYPMIISYLDPWDHHP